MKQKSIKHILCNSVEKLSQSVISTNYLNHLIKLDFRIKYSFRHHRKKKTFYCREDTCKRRRKSNRILNTNHVLDIKCLTRSEGLHLNCFVLLSNQVRYGISYFRKGNFESFLVIQEVVSSTSK